MPRRPATPPARPGSTTPTARFYRLYVVSFSFARNVPGGGNVYNGSISCSLPLVAASSSAGSFRS